jgi:hypothetical protein
LKRNPNANEELKVEENYRNKKQIYQPDYRDTNQHGLILDHKKRNMMN